MPTSSTAFGASSPRRTCSSSPTARRIAPSTSRGSAGALVAPLPFNQGLGAALQTGYRYALRGGYDYCAHLDADGQHRPEDLARLLEAVASGDYGLALGSRYVMPSSAELIDDAYRASPSRRIGIVLFRTLLSFTSRHRFTDTTSGFRAADRRVMTLFARSYAPDFHELESLQRAVRQGVKIAEIPVTMLPRAAGKTKITPLKSAFFVFKGLMVLGIGSFRRAAHGGARPRRAERGAKVTWLAQVQVAAEDVAPVNLTAQTRLLAAILAIGLLAGVFECIRRHKLQERYAVLWVGGGLALLLGAAVPDTLQLLARVMGVRDTNVALFILVLFLLLSLAFHFTLVLSRQGEQITRLAQDQAIYRASQQAAEVDEPVHSA